MEKETEHSAEHAEQRLISGAVAAAGIINCINGGDIGTSAVIGACITGAIPALNGISDTIYNVFNESKKKTLAVAGIYSGITAISAGMGAFSSTITHIITDAAIDIVSNPTIMQV